VRYDARRREEFCKELQRLKEEQERLQQELAQQQKMRRKSQGSRRQSRRKSDFSQVDDVDWAALIAAELAEAEQNA